MKIRASLAPKIQRLWSCVLRQPWRERGNSSDCVLSCDFLSWCRSKNAFNLSPTMNIVGSLCFCSDCGSLLDLSSGTSTIKCDHCRAPYSTNGPLSLETALTRQIFLHWKSQRDLPRNPCHLHSEPSDLLYKRRTIKKAQHAQRCSLTKQS
jgi:LSD1 subclass zinc finger protein